MKREKSQNIPRQRGLTQQEKEEKKKLTHYLFLLYRGMSNPNNKKNVFGRIELLKE